MTAQRKNILDEIEEKGEGTVKQFLLSFSCPVNPKIENFLHNRAIDFARRKISITYLVNDTDDGQLLGFVTLTHKAVIIPREGLSNTSRKRLERFAWRDPVTGDYVASAFLIAQIGKNYGVDDGKRISGQDLMLTANDILVDIQHQIGGGIVYLDCEDVEKLQKFYEKEKFQIFGDRYSEEEEQKYYQYMRFLY